MLNKRFVLGSLFAVIIIAVFNWNRPPLETGRQAAFREWYASAVPPLQNETAPTNGSSDLKVRIKVQGDSSGHYAAPHEYILPGNGSDPARERERIARILQLIAEAQLFSMTPIGTPTDGGNVLSVAITDGQKQFETTIPYETVRDNIQLQNLLKLLDLFEGTSQSETLNPSRL